MTKELRDLTVTKIALVRRGYRPVNDGARITVVKAQEDTPMGQQGTPDGSLVERFIKAMRNLFAGEPSDEGAAEVEKAGLKINNDGRHASHTGSHSHNHSDLSSGDHEHEHAHDGDSNHSHEHVQKAQTGTMIVADDGSHGRTTGIHTHSHSHGDGKGGAYAHTHEHNHDGESYHYHDYEAGHAEVAKAEHVEKADSGCTCDGVCKDGCSCGGKCGKGCTCDCEKVEKATGTADAQVSALITQMEGIVAGLKAAQAKDIELEKAIPTAETLAKIVDDRVTAALEPMLKAIEDLGIEWARRSHTPNVTAVIDPKKNGTADAETRRQAVADMSFSEAVRYLTHT